MAGEQVGSVIKVPYVITMPAPVRVICQAPTLERSGSRDTLASGRATSSSIVSPAVPQQRTTSTTEEQKRDEVVGDEQAGNNAASHSNESDVLSRVGSSSENNSPSQLIPPTVLRSRPSSPQVPTHTSAMDGISTTSASSTASVRSEGSRFWKPAVKRFYELYLERKHQDLVDIFLRLDVLHWRQLLEFLNAFRAFLLQHAPYEEKPSPPALPADVLVYIMTSYLTGDSVPPAVSELSQPRWYMEGMVLMRLLLGSGAPRSPNPESRGAGLPTPPLVVQFFIHTISSSAASAFLLTAGVHGREAAWQRHGGDVLLAMQHVILRLYPNEAGAFLDGPREPVAASEMPSFIDLCLCASLHFSSHLLIPNSPPEADDWWNIRSQVNQDNASETPSANSSSQFSSVLRCLSMLSRATTATKKIGDRFVLCLGDTLRQFLGPAPKRPSDLPVPTPPLKSSVCEESSGVVDMKDVGRIVRTILHAHNIDRARLAAREDGRRQAMRSNGCASDDVGFNVDVLSGSFAGPSEPGDFVPVLEQGPLRRSLAFMEQSALLHMVQSKLCAAHFPDVVGANEHLSMFALRNINVLWFDLRRCTSTLKQDTSSRVEEVVGSHAGGMTALLVLRNLRLGLAPDWEAKLATFPYLHLAGASRVTVKSLAITIRFSVSYGSGIVLRSVDVGIPELDIQLVCMSTLSQIILSLVVSILQETMKEHIQSQLQKHLLQLMRAEFEKFNYSVWKFLTTIVPEQLVSRSLNGFGAGIPPEGLPI